MIHLSSTAELLAAIGRAQAVEFRAYVLRPGRVLDALEGAALRGARVRVRLEAHPFADRSGELERTNAAAAQRLRGDGADAVLADADGRHPSHIKEVRADGAIFLDDRNFPDDGRDTIVRAEPGDFATVKDDALVAEAHSIYAAADRREGVAVESESFGFGRIYAALKYAAMRVPVRLLVAQRDVTPRSLPSLRRLSACGVTVRAGTDDEKFAVAPRGAWVGSANASSGAPAQPDWGARVFDPQLVRALTERFERNWSAASPLR